MARKILSVILALAVSLSMVQIGLWAADDGVAPTELTAAEGFAGGDGSSEESPYLIETAGQLKLLADKVNAGDTEYNSKFYKLTADIDLGGEANGSWTPIGTDSTNSFSGTFDGGGHLISGLYIDSTVYYQGLFGYVDGGTIKNLGVDGDVTGSYYVGGVVGGCLGSTVENCYNTGTVSGTTSSVGGVVGTSNRCTVQNCYNTGSVSGTGNSVGGVVGASNGTNSTASTVQNCYNTGSVSGDDQVGGVVGRTNSYNTVQNCYNTGSVSGGDQVGGVAGRTISNNTVKNCYNTGSVSGGDQVGGVAGSSGHRDTVENCYNTGSISGGDQVGGVVGSGDSDVTVENCYFLKNNTTNANLEGIGSESVPLVWNVEGKTAEDFKTLASTLNRGDSAWQDNEYHGRPILTANSEPYLIYDVDSMERFRDYINGTGDFSGSSHTGEGDTFRLTADIDLNGNNSKQWEPIGVFDGNNYSDHKPFSGVFDGGGYEVSGLYIRKSNQEDNYGLGLFGYIDENGTVKNLKTSGNISATVQSGYSVGGIAGYSEGTIEKCENAVIVTSKNYVGGIVGTNYGTVKECSNTAAFTSGAQYVGGIAGDNRGTIEESHNDSNVTGSGNNFDQYVGGIVGKNSGGTVQNCYNTDEISGVNNAGGIAGQNYDGTIESCYNTDEVSGNNDNVGGIVGYQINSGTMQNCYNTGDIKGGNNIGGICGNSDYGYGVKFINCHNDGTVEASGNGYAYAGGIVGFGNCTAISCYNTGSVTSADIAGGISSQYGTLEYCYNGENATVTGNIAGGIAGQSAIVKNCYNAGTVEGKGISIGGIAGGWSEIENCYNIGKITGTAIYAGSITGSGNVTKNCYYLEGGYFGIGGTDEDTIGQTESKTEEEFNSGEVTWLLQNGQAEQVWGQKLTGEDKDDYPVLDSDPAINVQKLGNTTYTDSKGNEKAFYVNPPADTVYIPDGATVKPAGGELEMEIGENGGKTAVDGDGNITLPEGGSVKVGDTTATLPEGGEITPNGDDAVNVPEGTVVELENGTKATLPDGGVIDKDGNIVGGTIEVGGTVVTAPDDNSVFAPDGKGNVYIPDGSTVKPEDDFVITIGDNGDKTTVDGDGNIHLPDDGTIEIGNTTITAPEGGGTIEPQGDGTVKVPAGSTVGDVVLKEDSFVDKDGKLLLPDDGGSGDDDGNGDDNKDNTIDINGTTAILPEDGEPEYNDDGSVTIPGDSKVIFPSKTEVELPEEGTVAEDGKSVEVPGGTVVKPGNGGPEITVGEKGGTVYEDGSVEVPEDGSIGIGDTTVTAPEGGTFTPNEDGTVTVPDGSVVETPGAPDITIGDNNNGEATVDEKGNVTLPEGGSAQIGDDTTVTLPDGGTIEPNGDGTVILPEGSVVKTGDKETVLPDGGIIDGDGNIVGEGVRVGDNIVIVPSDGETERNEDGSVTVPEGSIVIPGNGGPEMHLPDGGTVYEDGSVEVPEGGSIKIGDTTVTVPEGGTFTPNEDGTVTVPDGSVVKTPGAPDITVGDNGDQATVDEEGNVTLPDGNATVGEAAVTVPEGEAITPNEDGTVTLPENSTVTPPGGPEMFLPDGGNVDGNGNVTLPEGGSIEIGDDVTVTLPDGGTVEVGEDGTVTIPGGSTIEIGGETVEVPDGSVAVYDPKTGKIEFEEAPAQPGASPNPDDVIISSGIGENAPNVSIDEESAAKLREEIIAEHLTDEEREAVANGASLEIILSVEIAEATVSDGDRQSTEAIIADTEYTIGQYLSIELLKLINGELSEKITRLNTPISITFEIPEELRAENRKFAVVRVHDGVAEILEDQDDDPNTITVTTDRFSTYAIVYQDNAGMGDGNPNTGAVFVIAPFVAAAAGVILSKKRK